MLEATSAVTGEFCLSERDLVEFLAQVVVSGDLEAMSEETAVLLVRLVVREPYLDDSQGVGYYMDSELWEAVFRALPEDIFWETVGCLRVTEPYVVAGSCYAMRELSDTEREFYVNHPDVGVRSVLLTNPEVPAERRWALLVNFPGVSATDTRYPLLVDVDLALDMLEDDNFLGSWERWRELLENPDPVIHGAAADRLPSLFEPLLWESFGDLAARWWERSVGSAGTGIADPDVEEWEPDIEEWARTLFRNRLCPDGEPCPWDGVSKLVAASEDDAVLSPDERTRRFVDMVEEGVRDGFGRFRLAEFHSIPGQGVMAARRLELWVSRYPVTAASRFVSETLTDPDWKLLQLFRTVTTWDVTYERLMRKVQAIRPGWEWDDLLTWTKNLGDPETEVYLVLLAATLEHPQKLETLLDMVPLKYWVGTHSRYLAATLNASEVLSPTGLWDKLSDPDMLEQPPSHLLNGSR